MTTALKIAIPSFIGISTVGGVVTGYYYLTPRTKIKDSLIYKIRLITENFGDNIWKIAFNENKDSKELTTIQPKITDFNKLKKWCIDNYEIKTNDKDILKKVEKLCEFPPTTISNKLEKDKKSFVSNWDTKFNGIKSNSEQLVRLKAINSNLSNIETSGDGKNKLKQWCDEQKNNELIPESYQEAYKKVIEFCT